MRLWSSILLWVEVVHILAKDQKLIEPGTRFHTIVMFSMVYCHNLNITNRSQSEIKWSRQKNWAKLQCQPILWKSSTRRQGLKATESVSRSFISFIVSTCYGKSHTKTIIQESGVACWLLAQRNYRTIPVNTPAYQPLLRMLIELKTTVSRFWERTFNVQQMWGCSLSTCFREILFHGRNWTHGTLAVTLMQYGTGRWSTQLEIWKDLMRCMLVENHVYR